MQQGTVHVPPLLPLHRSTARPLARILQEQLSRSFPTRTAANASTAVPRMRATYWRFGDEQLDWLQPRVVTPASLPAGAESAEVLDLTGSGQAVHFWSTLSVLNYGEAGKD